MSNAFIIINEIEELLNDMNDSLTTTINTVNTNVNSVKTTVDTINTNVNTLLTNTGVNNTASTTGTLSQKISSTIANTATNNTASATGILSQKLSHIISLLGTTNNYARGYTVTPSSTNLKTLATGLTVEMTRAQIDSSDGISYNNGICTKYGTTYTAYIQYDGIYRAQTTASVTITQAGATTNASPANTYGFKGYVDIFVFGPNGEQQTVTLTQTYTSGTYSNIAAATKSNDIYLSVGSRVQIRPRIESYALFSGCGNTYGYVGKLVFTDISIRGTANIIDAAIV